MDAGLHSQTMDFMDFYEENSSKCQLTRPILSRNRQQTYNAEFHCVRALDEMHRLYRSGKLCDVTIYPNDYHLTNANSASSESISSMDSKDGQTEYHQASPFKRFKRNEEINTLEDGQGIKCHRLMLAASSAYFERMFAGDMSESNAKDICLNSISYDTLLKLVEFCYTCKITLDRLSVLDVFEASDMFQFISVRSFCEDFLLEEIDSLNCLSFLLYAEAYSTNILYCQAFSVAIKEFVNIYKTQEFLHLPLVQVEKILNHDSVVVEYEEDIYNAFKNWIMFCPNERIQHLFALFKCVRLNFVSRWFLIEVISKDELIRSDADCVSFVQRAKDQLLAVGHTYEMNLQMPLSRINTGLTYKIVYVNTHDPNPTESEVFLFDVVNKSWSKTSRSCPLASKLSSCVSLGESLLIIGGWANKIPGQKSMNQSGALGLVHEFKVMSIFPTLWYLGSHNMGICRYMHSTITHNSDLYLVGGFDEGRNLQNGCYIASASSSYRFELQSNLIFNVAKPALAIHKNTLYAFGGLNRDWKHLPYVQHIPLTPEDAARGWRVANLPEETRGYAYLHACPVGDRVYCVCGAVKEGAGAHWGEVDERFVKLKAIVRFSPETFAMDLVFMFPSPRSGPFTIAEMNGRIYITGGYRDRQYCSAIEAYDIESETMEIVGNSKEGPGTLSLSTTMKVMHENFGL